MNKYILLLIIHILCSSHILSETNPGFPDYYSAIIVFPEDCNTKAAVESTNIYKISFEENNSSQILAFIIETNAAFEKNGNNGQLAKVKNSPLIDYNTLSNDLEKKDSEISVLHTNIAKANTQRKFLLASEVILLLLVGGIFYQYWYVRKTNKIITEERNKSDNLLLNILPEETAEELKTNGFVKTKKYKNATVLFTDFVNFTGKSSKIDPETLIESVDYYFRNFDEIVDRHNMEKIKTIGDSYMCVGGLPQKNDTNTIDAVKTASEMLYFVERNKKNPPDGITPFDIRIGINSGPLVAGVVGTRKFQYDIWGDTVNVASRMESNCEPNQINVSQNVFDVLKNDIPFKYRGEIKVKNRGKMKMYYLNEVARN